VNQSGSHGFPQTPGWPQVRYFVLAMTAAATITTDRDTDETTLSWVAYDERGRELEIVAIESPAAISSFM